jgi:tight adherence protein C
MLVVGLIAVALAIGVLVFVFAERSEVKSPAELRETAMVGAPTVGVPGGSAPSRAAVNFDPEEVTPLLDRLGVVAAKLSPGDYGRRLQRRLDLAGNPPAWPANRVLAMKGALLIFGVLIGAVLGAKHGIWVVIGPILLGAFLFFVPDLLVRNAGEHRQIEILKGLPDALDMMTVCVEAGLGFDAALSRVALNLEGPMASECARVLQEMQFGKSRADALRALVDRTDVTELRAFVSALIQSAELGISLGVVLREQAKEMRIRRRQRAEEQAQKLPVKILLPLITCLLPAMFVVVLGPALIHIFKTLGHINGH